MNPESLKNDDSTSQLTPGTVLEDRYEILRLIGEGTFASVYEARHLVLHSKHALKILELSSPEIRLRFADEGRIQGQLRHPNIVSVTDVITGDYAGLVMDFVPGGSLAEYLEELGHPLDLQETLRLMLPVLEAMDYAHSKGIVHRDLKPENILLDRGPDGSKLVPVVTDFGIAKVLDQSELHAAKAKTRAGTEMGTPHYMSPEQIRASHLVDARSDIFALGAILYELATGQRAFGGDTQFDTWQRIVAGEYTAPERVVGNLHPTVAACIRSALATDPDERFQSCAAFHDALEGAIVPGRPLPQRPSHSAASTLPPQQRSSAEPAAQQSLPSSRSSPQATPSPGSQLPQEVDMWVLIIASVVTFGIYGFYRFYKTGEVYETLAGRRSSFRGLFWTYLLGSFFFSLLSVTSDGETYGLQLLFQLVLGPFLLGQMLNLRNIGVQRYWGAPPGMNSRGAHLTLWILGKLFSIALIGIPLLLLQTYLYFKEYNLVVRAIRSEYT